MTRHWFLPALLSLSSLIACGESGPTPEPLAFEEEVAYVPTYSTPDGEACQRDGDCISGDCITDSPWQGGHCTTRNCSSDSDCEGPDSICVGHGYQGAICVQSCSPGPQNFCRDGYVCESIEEFSGFCIPEQPSVPTGQTSPIPVVCEDAQNGIVQLPYDIAEDTSSYMLVPYVPGGNNWLQVQRVTSPNGNINFGTTNRFQLSSFAFAGLNPLIVPGAPGLESQLQPGSHTLQVRTDGAAACLWVVESPRTPEILDINLYLVGLEATKGITPANAPTHSNLRQVLALTEEILSQSNIEFGRVRFRSFNDSLDRQFRVIRSENDVAAVLGHTEPPGSTADDAISINVVLTTGFTFGPLGVSMGAPGAAASHGEWFSGVVLSGQYIGLQGNEGNELTAVTFAHEMGHYIGLPHTSEISGDEFDFFEDTPQCSDFDERRPWLCTDWGFLMFPIADQDNRTLSEGQSFVIRANPLTKPARKTEEYFQVGER